MSIDLARLVDRHDARLRRVESAPPGWRSVADSFFWSEDFIGGTEVSGNFGEKGWTFTLAGSATLVNSFLSGHPGLAHMITGATINSLVCMHVGSSLTIGFLRPSNAFDLRGWIRTSTAITSMDVRFGLGLSPQVNAPADGMWIEKLNTDTNWFGVNKATVAGVPTITRVDTTVAMAVSTWYKVRLRRVSSGVYGFSVNDSTEVTMTVTPAVVNEQIFLQFINTAASTRTLDFDLAELTLQALNR